MWLTAIDSSFFDSAWAKVAGAVAGALFIAFVTRVVQAIASRRISDGDRRYRLRKAVGFLGYAATIVAVVAIFRNDLGGLSVAIGVAGAGVAFALQEVIASFAGWFAISLASFYRTGDRVQLGGIKGDVIDIGILRTTVMEIGEWVDGDLYTGRIVRIANSFVFKEPVFNYSGDFPFLWDEIVVPVRNGSDWKEARRIIEKAVSDTVGSYVPESEKWWPHLATAFRLEQASLEPTVTMRVTDNWIEFTGRYVVDYRKRRSTKDAIFTRVLTDFDASGGRVTVGSQTIEVLGNAPVRTGDGKQPAAS
ncbi:MAG: mechanosensitive ion channel family protein [Dehalococcoidia bacterium]